MASEDKTGTAGGGNLVTGGFNSQASVAVAATISGAALRRMQALAQSLYDSTPGLQEGIEIDSFHFNSLELPRNTSKILESVKKPPTTSTALLGEFDKKGFSGAGDTYLKKVDKKDLSTCNHSHSLYRKCRNS